jgi:hypothetical protein
VTGCKAGGCLSLRFRRNRGSGEKSSDGKREHTSKGKLMQAFGGARAEAQESRLTGQARQELGPVWEGKSLTALKGKSSAVTMGVDRNSSKGAYKRWMRNDSLPEISSSCGTRVINLIPVRCSFSGVCLLSCERGLDYCTRESTNEGRGAADLD